MIEELYQEFCVVEKLAASQMQEFFKQQLRPSTDWEERVMPHLNKSYELSRKLVELLKNKTYKLSNGKYLACYQDSDYDWQFQELEEIV